MTQKLIPFLFTFLLSQLIVSDGWSSMKHSHDSITNENEKPHFTLLYQHHCYLDLIGRFNENYDPYFYLMLSNKITSLELNAGFDDEKVDIRQPLISYLNNDNCLQSLVARGLYLKEKDALKSIFLKKSLRHLTLHCHSDEQYDFDGDLTPELIIAECLKKNTTLKSLNLHGHILYWDGMDESPILQAFQSNTTLEEVEIEGGEDKNGLRTSQITDLCQVLEKNSTLKKLSLIAQEYPDEAVPRIVQALEKNTTLIELDMRQNRFPENHSSLLLLENWNKRGKCQILHDSLYPN